MSAPAAPARPDVRAPAATPLDAQQIPLGGRVRADGSASFLVWAPLVEQLRVQLHGTAAAVHPLHSLDHGYHAAIIADVPAGTHYTFVLPDGRELPDPASRAQPEGVHGPSALVSDTFPWQHDSWRTPDLRDLVIYELHVGTFTEAGTFDAAIERLRDLRDLGITAIELMPIAQFPGERNWGYDGVLAFAAQSSYGGPDALRRLVDAAHGLDLAVVLDVVYNHFGPEGNYLPLFAPYFTDTYHTPWGAALNFDDRGSDHVRRYFIESALQWTDEFRIDALRLDAIHAIHDRSAQPFLRELAAAVHRRAEDNGRTVVLIAESDLGDPRVVRDERLGGLDMDAQWLDDFHHSLRTLITRESSGYYADFGTLGHLARAYQHGYVYDGAYSRFRQRRHGAPGPDILPRQFVVYAQNHDQVGNRMRGDRLTGDVTPAQLRLAAAAVLLSPFTPMLFMGEEYGETRPFPYFVSHGDEALIEAVRHGRREEFASFAWQGEPPDPQSEETFRSAVLDWGARNRGTHAHLLALYRRLLEIRRTARAIRHADSIATEIVDADGRAADGSGADGVIIVKRRAPDQSSILLLNFAAEPASVRVGDSEGAWARSIDTDEETFGGSGTRVPDVLHGPVLDVTMAPHSAVLLLHDEV
jgi:maltooligosyltrehalose trehalohydrolase